MHKSNSTAAAGEKKVKYFFFFACFSKSSPCSRPQWFHRLPLRACAFSIPPIDGSSVTEFSFPVSPYCYFSVWLASRLNEADGPPETLLSASQLIRAVCPVTTVSMHTKGTPNFSFFLCRIAELLHSNHQAMLNSSCWYLKKCRAQPGHIARDEKIVQTFSREIWREENIWMYIAWNGMKIFRKSPK